MAPQVRMNPILDCERTMKISPLSPAAPPDDTRTSIAFRVLIAVATCLLVVLGFASMQKGAAAHPLTLGAALLASGCVFVLADVLLACLIVAIPPGLFVLAFVALLKH
jgi:hypothetical protein